jgi:RND superfamily putative drug exporter
MTQEEQTMKTHSNFTGRLGRWSTVHPWRAITLWLIFVIGVMFAGKTVGNVQLSMAHSGNGSSGRAAVVLSQAFPVHANEQVLVQSRTLTAGEAPFRAAVADVIGKVEAAGNVQALRSPYAPGNPGAISRDGHSALVSFEVSGDMNTADKRVVPIEGAVAAAARAYPGVSIREAGDASVMKATNDRVMKDYRQAETLSLPITLIVLLFTFGALAAALLPIALAMSAVLAAGGLLAFASHLNPNDQAASSVLLLIGLAVGVDYSLFYVKRAREERAAGATAQGALHAAAATSGRAVLISGITVLIAMAGMFMSGSPVFYGVACASVLVVGVAVIGSLTVLPAILSLLGDRIERGRIPGISRLRSSNGQSRVWGSILDKVLRRPVVAMLISAGALVALAVPVLGMHTASPAANDLTVKLPVLQTYSDIQRIFPGGPTPAIVAIQARDVTAPAVERGIVALERDALRTGQMHDPMFVQVSRDRSVAMVMIPLAGSGQDNASTTALHTLRERVIPATIGKVPDTSADVTGLTAQTVDFNNLMHHRMPLVFGFVLFMAFGLLLVSFRSIVIAFKAIILNLLSVGAAYGVLVWVFQDGHGQGLLHFHSTHAITSWLPLFMFVVLFGLSMDYHVFILSRIREAHDRGESTSAAVSHGIKATAGTVTAAAVVMVMVFSVFATLSMVSMKEAGIGLATAVVLDATLVRIVLLPASMKLLGDWNWYLPRWLEWIPRIGHEPSVGQVEDPVPEERPASVDLPKELVGAIA